LPKTVSIEPGLVAGGVWVHGAEMLSARRKCGADSAARFAAIFGHTRCCIGARSAQARLIHAVAALFPFCRAHSIRFEPLKQGVRDRIGILRALTRFAPLSPEERSFKIDEYLRDEDAGGESRAHSHCV
jgi:hypothetical protein